jgi:hypothetical protein
MTKEEQKDILIRLIAGEPVKVLAEYYGISVTHVRRSAVACASSLHPYVGWTVPKIKAHRETLKAKLRSAA